MSLRLAVRRLGFVCLTPFLRAAAVDYERDVRPILEQHCVACHRPDEVAPFSLVTQSEAVRHARMIGAVARTRRMPPWKAAHLPGAELTGERRLTEREIRTLAAWSQRPIDGPGRIPLPERREWALGTPDLILEMPEPFSIPAAGTDIYQCFVTALPPGPARWVRAFEFQAGNRRVVHHAIALFDRSGEARRRDAAEPSPGYRCFGVPGFLPSGALGGWSPGNRAYEYGTGSAVRWPGSGDLVFQIHYHGTGKPESDRSRVGVYFAEKPPLRTLLDIPLGSRQIDIPAGERRYRVRDSFTLPVDVEIESVIPHAHYLARRMRGWARLPNGVRRELLRIEDWDFNWQESYRYRTPLRLPQGTRLEMEFEYDNSAANPRNPSRPPQRVRWGPETTDEMAGLHFAVKTFNDADQEELGRTLWGKMMRFLRQSL